MMTTAKAPTLRADPAPLGSSIEGLIDARYTCNHGEHELLLLTRDVNDRQVDAVRSEEAEFALVADGPLVLLGSRFGDAIPWAVTSLCWHHWPREGRVMPPEPGSPEEGRIQLAVVLAEFEGRAVRGSGCVTLPLDFSRVLNEAIRDQARISFDPKEHARALTDLRRRCPTARSIMARASWRASGIR